MIRNINRLSSFTVILGLALVACSSNSASYDELEGAPEVAAVQMPLTGNAKTDASATEADAIDPATLTADELTLASVPDTTDAVDLGQIRGEVKRLNASVRDFLGPIAAMIRDTAPSREVGLVRFWGPVVRGATEYRFFLREDSAKKWGWRLDARIADSDEAYSRVAAGKITVGQRQRRGVGVMGFDLDALAAVDPTVTAQGKVLIGFKHGELGTTVGYAVRDFTRDPMSQTPVDALMRAVHLKDGFNRLRMAYHGNIDGTTSTAEELVLARVRHQKDVGGRSDMVVLSGDIPAGEAWVVSNCWNKDLKSRFRAVRTCPLDGIGGDTCVAKSTQGDLTACPSSLQTAEIPPVDPTAPMVDNSDPNDDVTPPNTMPTVDDALSTE